MLSGLLDSQEFDFATKPLAIELVPDLVSYKTRSASGGITPGNPLWNTVISIYAMFGERSSYLEE